MKRSSRNYAEGESPRERIVNAASRLFGSKGFYATTTAELAEEASVSVGQIYRLFTDKDDVILAIVEENVRVRLAEMHSIFDAVERRELAMRSEEHTSELQSLMRISYAVFCLNKKT